MFGFTAPKKHGHDAVNAIRSMVQGTSKALICLGGNFAVALPCLGRTELDIQASGRQSITVEDSMSMVHTSSGKLKPASEFLRSEPAIVAGMAQAVMPDSKVPWLELIADYSIIRDLIEKTIPGFDNYNAQHRCTRRIPHADAADQTPVANANR